MKQLYKSLAAFQQEVPTIHQGTKGYSYTYASLSQILDVINPLLAKHKLGFTQPINGNTIKTILFCTETGESIESEVSIPNDVQLKGMNEFQVLGSAITYLRRYSLSSILGLITDKDTDAAGEQKPKPNQINPEIEIAKQKISKVNNLEDLGNLYKENKEWHVINEIKEAFIKRSTELK